MAYRSIFAGHGTSAEPGLLLQTAICFAKRQWMSGTSNLRRHFIFDSNGPIFRFLGILGHSTSVLNCAIRYLKIHKITCSLVGRVWVFNTIGIFNTFKSVLDIGIFNTFEIFPQTEVLVLNIFIFQVPIPNTFVFQKT